MSKQQGQSPEPEVKTRKPGKKRHGIYELWMRYNPDLVQERISKYGLSVYTPSTEWHRIRKYETRELAEKNKADSERKWNAWFNNEKPPTWQFEVREKS